MQRPHILGLLGEELPIKHFGFRQTAGPMV